MKYEHVFKSAAVIYKNRALGFSFLSFGAPIIKNVMHCKYCNYCYSENIVQRNIPNCISDDEKIIKDILE